MARRKWKLTVRSGGEVEHVSFDDLDEAVAAMRGKALEIRSEGPARPIRSLRRFEPSDLVNARLQLTGPGRLFRKPTAGVDVRGDGTFVPFAGGVAREELDPTDHDTPFDIVRETLEEKD
ncbi:MAG: hypothetical protein JST31_15785 [Actinobacteria bacterium]|nr:hypothetical protein [Actinomycetota bacterium]